MHGTIHHYSWIVHFQPELWGLVRQRYKVALSFPFLSRFFLSSFLLLNKLKLKLNVKITTK
jgi:hypothetical protein